MGRDLPVADLLVGQELLLYIEAIEGLPVPADLRLHHKLLSGPNQAKRFVGRGLL